MINFDFSQDAFHAIASLVELWKRESSATAAKLEQELYNGIADVIMEPREGPPYRADPLQRAKKWVLVHSRCMLIYDFDEQRETTTFLAVVGPVRSLTEQPLGCRLSK